MAIGQGQTLGLKSIEAAVAFEQGKEAFDVTALTLVTAGAGYPVESDQELLASLASIKDHLGDSAQNSSNEGQDIVGEVGGIRLLANLEAPGVD